LRSPMRHVPNPSTGILSPVLSVTVRICRSLAVRLAHSIATLQLHKNWAFPSQIDW
jgi:hypothetical protein